MDNSVLDKTPYDAGDEGQVKKKKTKAQIHKEQNREDLKAILDMPGGRRFLWKLLEECGVYKISFIGEPYQTAFNEGKRQIGLRLIEDIFDAYPHAYTGMRVEATHRKEARNG